MTNEIDRLNKDNSELRGKVDILQMKYDNIRDVDSGVQRDLIISRKENMEKQRD